MHACITLSFLLFLFPSSTYCSYDAINKYLGFHARVQNHDRQNTTSNFTDLVELGTPDVGARAERCFVDQVVPLTRLLLGSFGLR